MDPGDGSDWPALAAQAAAPPPQGPVDFGDGGDWTALAAQAAAAETVAKDCSGAVSTCRVVDPDPDPDWIRIRNLDPNPDPGGQK